MEALFAVCAPGLEPVLASELAELGVHGAVEPGGVAWSGDAASLYAANLRLRTASRVTMLAATFRAKTFFELERHARRVPWERWVAPGGRVRLRVTCRKSRLYHEGAVAERVLDAIGVRLGAAVGGESAAGEEDDEGGAEGQLFVVRFHRDQCTIRVDGSGELLYLRGYRRAVARAPLRETLAAAMLRASPWRPGAALLDPMCGSGTLPIEAALMDRRIAPGLASAERTPRNFAFTTWPEFDATAWAAEVERAQEEIRPGSNAPIVGSDRDAGAIDAARANAERAGVADSVEWSVCALSAVEPPADRGWLVTNPPYGVRVGERDPLRNLYAALGRVARERLPGWGMALLGADRVLEGQLALELEEAFRTTNGGIPVRLLVARR
jgi:putative N6-adenine-specific DNA methylase